ncbi:MAG: ribulose-phosphate 3-epimerase, partial [Bdellovibrionaceae bacterium]|nr:ribulose-phosphate 3-epimerase [Pseudobdellovibrionaceae bacterium]
HFVPNLTIGAPVVKALKKISPLPLDVHLMIEKPERYIDDFLKAGSDWLTIHVEATTDVSGCLKRIRDGGVKAGLTLRPGTAIETVLPYLDQVDLVLVMTVEPGFGGQSFMEDQIEKITILRREIDRRNLQVLIEVDGGINEQTARLCRDADVLVAGSYVFKGRLEDTIRTLKNSEKGE